MEGSPYYAPRIYAELLVQLGREREAYDFLRQAYPKMPDIIYSQKDVVRGRIRDLEDSLGIAQEDRAVFEVEGGSEGE